MNNNAYTKSEGELVLSWQDIEQAIETIETQIQQDGYTPDIIIAISRSGLIPGALLSYKRKQKELAVLKIDFSKTQKKGNDQDLREDPILTQPITIDIQQKNILVIDEVVVSGKTLTLAHSYLHEQHPADIRYAVICKQPWATFSPHYVAIETTAWPIFPWKKE